MVNNMNRYNNACCSGISMTEKERRLIYILYIGRNNAITEKCNI